MVCLAGAVIAGTLGCAHETHIDIATSDMAEPDSTIITNEQWRNALWALDSAREGNWTDAYRALHNVRPDDDLDDALEKLPPPERVEFESWNELTVHLDSLASRADDLRKLGL